MSNDSSEPSFGIRHTLDVDPQSGSLLARIGIPVPPSATGDGVDLDLTYDPQGRGAFGLGWQQPIPSVTRVGKSGQIAFDQHDHFSMAGMGRLVRDHSSAVRLTDAYAVTAWLPEHQSSFSRAEEWRDRQTGLSHWRMITTSGVVSIFGADRQARYGIDKAHTLTWYLTHRFWPTGEAERYVYALEDQEAAPRGTARYVYLKRVLWGNKTPLLPTSLVPAEQTEWAFESVLDYGDHGEGDALTPAPVRPWTKRSDPQILHGARAPTPLLRRCCRILIFHHLDGLTGRDALSREIKFQYQEEAATTGGAARLSSVDLTAHRTEASGQRTSLAAPPLTLSYNDNHAGAGPSLPWVRSDPAALAQLFSAPFTNALGTGESVSTRAVGGAWWTLEPAATPRQRIVPAKKAAGAGLPRVEGGRLRAARPLAATQGDDILPIAASPGRAARPPRQRVPGATARGYESSDRSYYVVGDAPAGYVFRRARGAAPGGEDRLLDRPKATALCASAATAPTEEDAAQGTVRATLVPGAATLVRVSQGRVRYWPIYGEGVVGEPHDMADAPDFGPVFDPARLIFVDLNGTGLDDLLYLGSDGVQIWYNVNGLRWQPGGLIALQGLGRASAEVRLADIDGDGALHLVSIPTSGHAPRRGVRLRHGSVGELSDIDAGVGHATKVTYAWSARRTVTNPATLSEGEPRAIAGHRMVVARIEDHDRLARSLVDRHWRYQSPFFDVDTDAFAGFALVETRAATREAAAPGLPLAQLAPPLRIRRWYHDGLSLDAPISPLHRLPGAWRGDHHAAEPPPPRLENIRSVSGIGRAAALRTLAASLVREEIWGGGDAPIEVSENSYAVRVMQDAPDACSVFAFGAQSTTRHYEGDPADPRETWQIALTVDAFGIETEVCDIALARRASVDPQSRADGTPAQDKTLVTVTQRSVAHLAERLNRTGLLLREDRWQIEDTGLTEDIGQAGRAPLSAAHIKALVAAADKVRIGAERVLYRSVTGGETSDPSQIAAPALPVRRDSAAFSEAAVRETYGDRVQPSKLVNLGYDLDGGLWWRPGTAVKTEGESGFFRPSEYRDASGATTSVTWHETGLARVREVDAEGLVSAHKIDPFALQPFHSEDPNGWQRERVFDPFGRIIAEGHRRALPGLTEGDEPATGFVSPYARLAQEGFEALVEEALSQPSQLLQGLSVAEITDDLAPIRDGQPTPTLRVERISGDQAGLADVAVSVTYKDGSGRMLQSRVLAEQPLQAVATPAPVPADSAGGNAGDDPPPQSAAPMPPRWRVSGTIERDGAGRIARGHAPVFGAGHQYNPADGLRGLTDLLQYDALGRVVRVEHADGFFSRTRFSPWSIVHEDRNDTAGEVSPAPNPAPGPTPDPTRDPTPEQSRLAALAHAQTPDVDLLDPLGRVCVRRAVTEVDILDTLYQLDPSGDVIAVTGPGVSPGTAPHRTARFDLAGLPTATVSADDGERLVLHDAAGNIAEEWTADGRHVSYRRNGRADITEIVVSETAGNARVVEKTVYGEKSGDLAAARAGNGLGRPVEILDGAGKLTISRYNRQGDRLVEVRQPVADPAAPPDWSAAPALADHTVTLARTLDRAGQLTEETLSLSASLGEGSAKISRILSPSGEPLEISAALVAPGTLGTLGAPDAQGDLGDRRRMLLSGQNLDAEGRVLESRLGSGLIVSRQRQGSAGATRRLEVKQHKPGGVTVLGGLTYSRDPEGNTVSVDNTLRRQAGAAPRGSIGDDVDSTRYQYDALYRLTRVDGWKHAAFRHSASASGPPAVALSDRQAMTRYSHTYTYDHASNRTQISEIGGATTALAVAPDSNRLAGMQYDAAGRLRALESVPHLTWTWRGELARAVLVSRADASDAASDTATGTADGTPVKPDDQEVYAYDGSSKRVIRQRQRVTAAGTQKETTLSVGSFEITWQEVADRRGATRLRLTVPLAEGLHATLEDGAEPATQIEPLWVLSDRASGVTVSFGAGGLAGYAETTPLGSPVFVATSAALAGSARRALRFHGRIPDDATGLILFGARYYVPWHGRWLSPDPAGPVDGENLFVFGRQNPLRFEDPTGLSAEDDSLLDWAKKKAARARDKLKRAAAGKAAQLVLDGFQLGTAIVNPGGMVDDTKAPIPRTEEQSPEAKKPKDGDKGKKKRSPDMSGGTGPDPEPKGKGPKPRRVSVDVTVEPSRAPTKVPDPPKKPAAKPAEMRLEQQKPRSDEIKTRRSRGGKRIVKTVDEGKMKRRIAREEKPIKDALEAKNTKRLSPSSSKALKKTAKKNLKKIGVVGTAAAVISVSSLAFGGEPPPPPLPKVSRDDATIDRLLKQERRIARQFGDKRIPDPPPKSLGELFIGELIPGIIMDSLGGELNVSADLHIEVTNTIEDRTAYVLSMARKDGPLPLEDEQRIVNSVEKMYRAQQDRILGR